MEVRLPAEVRVRVQVTLAERLRRQEPSKAPAAREARGSSAAPVVQPALSARAAAPALTARRSPAVHRGTGGTKGCRHPRRPAPRAAARCSLATPAAREVPAAPPMPTARGPGVPGRPAARAASPAGRVAAALPATEAAGPAAATDSSGAAAAWTVARSGTRTAWPGTASGLHGDDAGHGTEADSGRTAPGRLREKAQPLRAGFPRRPGPPVA